MSLIEMDTGLDPWVTPAWMVRASSEEVAANKVWRAQYLTKLILARREMWTTLEDTTDVDEFIVIICSS